MAKIYGALEVAQLEWFTDAGKPSPSQYVYRVIYVSDLKQVQVSDGTNWVPFFNTSTNQTISGDTTFSGKQIFTGAHNFSPTTDSSSGAILALTTPTPFIELTAATSLEGVVAASVGTMLILVNRTGGEVAVVEESGSASASNRIKTGTGSSIGLENNASLILAYASDSRWHIIGGAGGGGGWTADSSLSLADGNQISNSAGKQLQKWLVRAATSSGATLSVTPFLNTPSKDGSMVRLVCDSDDNWVAIENNDAAGGCILNGGPAQLFKYHSIDLMYDATMQRWIEISRNF